MPIFLALEELPWRLPQQNAGQIVEVSYAMQWPKVYKRVHDRSDGSTAYYEAQANDEDSGEYQMPPSCYRAGDWNEII